MAELRKEIAGYEADVLSEVEMAGDEKSLTERLIEWLSIRTLDRINQHEYDHPTLQRFIDPYFILKTFSLDSHGSEYDPTLSLQEIWAQNPDRVMEVLTASCTIEPSRSRVATVWTTLKHHGISASDGLLKDVPVDMLGKMRWLCRNARWTMVSFTGIRGFDPFGGL